MTCLSSSGFTLTQGTTATLFRSEITCKVDTTIQQITVLREATGYHATEVLVAYASTSSTTPVVFNATRGSVPPATSALISAGGWWAAWAPNESTNSHVWFNRGAAVRIDVRASSGTDFFTVSSAAQNVSVSAGTRLEPFEFAQLGISMTQPIHTLSDVTDLIAWLDAPTGLSLSKGSRPSKRSTGLFELAVDPSTFVTSMSVGQHPATDMMLPLHVSGLHHRWSVGMWQHTGYSMGHYSNGSDVYTGLGLDDFNSSFVPLYVGRAPRHNITIGHPVIAVGQDAEELVIQVTRINASVAHSQSPWPGWHVSVNNPLEDREITVQLRSSMPDLVPLHARELRLSAGEFLNLL